MGLLVLGLVLFILLVVVHEFGHFLMAKKNGVEVEEFGLFFPPKIYGKTLGRGIFKTHYSINLLPLGGFVKLKGEHDYDTQKGSYGAARLSSKVKIMIAGVTMNMIVALIMFTVVAWVGMPQIVDNQFGVKSDAKTLKSEAITNFVESNSPASKSGIKPGDIIKSIAGTNVYNTQDLRNATQTHAGKKVQVTYINNGQTRSTKATLLTEKVVKLSESTDNPKGYLGVSTTDYKLVRSTWSAPIVAVGVSGQLTGLTLKGIGVSLANLAKAVIYALIGHGNQARQKASAAGENVSGPVGIYAVLNQSKVLGYQFTLFVVAILSLSLAVMNILPIPALDGGRLFVTLLFRALKKPLLPSTEELIHGIGFTALMLLFVVITVVDIGRFF
jgi:regulator of sigma E protease